MGNEAQKFADKIHKAGEHAAAGMGLFKTAVASILSAEGLIELGKQAFEFGKDCVEAASKSQVSMILLKNEIKNLAGSGGPSFEQLEKQSIALSKTGIFSGEQILRGSTQALLQFRSIQGATFDRTQKEAIDAATAIYGVNASQEQLASVSETMGRAMQSGNIRSLRSLGVMFDERQTKLAEYYKKTMQMGALQEMVLSAIANNPKIKGAAAAVAESAEGMRRRMANQFEMMKIQIGNAILPVIDKLMQLGMKVMPTIQMAINNLLPIITAVTDIINDLWPSIEDLINAIMPLISGILSNFATGLSAIIHFVAPLIGWIVDLITTSHLLIPVLIAVGVAMTIAMGPVGWIIGGIVLLGMIIKNHTLIWNSLKQTVHNVLNSIFKLLDNPAIRTIGLIFLPFITIPLLIAKNFEKVKQVISDVVGLFTGKTGIGKVISDIVNLFAGKATVNTTSNYYSLTTAPVSMPNHPTVNVQTQNTLSVYKEKGIGVVPYKKGSKLGYQGTM